MKTFQNEGPKNILLFKAAKCSNVGRQLLKDFRILKKFNTIYQSHLAKKSDDKIKSAKDEAIHLATNYKCGFYCIATSSKKKPLGLEIGRLFNKLFLDSIKLKVLNYISIDTFRKSYTNRNIHEVSDSAASMVIIQGSSFSTGPMKQAKEILSDFFHSYNSGKIYLEGLEQVIIISSKEPDLIFIKRYKIILKNTTERMPRVELFEMGPSIDLQLTDSLPPDPELMKKALETKDTIHLTPGLDVDKKLAKRGKNVLTTPMADKVGKVYVQPQDFDKVYTPHTKLKRKRDKPNK